MVRTRSHGSRQSAVALKTDNWGDIMRKSALFLLPLALAMTACGNDSAQQAAAPAAAPAPTEAAAPPAEAAAPAAAPVVADEATAAPVSDEVVYDPIDTSKLAASWWEQYNK